MKSDVKNNQKSVRLSDYAVEIIEKQQGEGFSKKFESLVYEYARKSEEIKEKVRDLEARESFLRRKVSELIKVRDTLESIGKYVEQIEGLISRRTFESFCEDFTIAVSHERLTGMQN